MVQAGCIAGRTPPGFRHRLLAERFRAILGLNGPTWLVAWAVLTTPVSHRDGEQTPVAASEAASWTRRKITVGITWVARLGSKLATARALTSETGGNQSARDRGGDAAGAGAGGPGAAGGLAACGGTRVSAEVGLRAPNIRKLIADGRATLPLRAGGRSHLVYFDRNAQATRRPNEDAIGAKRRVQAGCIAVRPTRASPGLNAPSAAQIGAFRRRVAAQGSRTPPFQAPQGALGVRPARFDGPAGRGAGEPTPVQKRSSEHLVHR